jgi:uncharacterized protein YneR
MIRKQPVSVQMHTGGIEGFSTVIARLPEENSCLIILRNCDNQNLFNPYRIAFNMMINKPYNLPKIRKPITISPEKRKEYEGEYSASPDFSIKIFVENGKIMTQATNQEVIEIFAESEDNFFLKVVDAQIKFEREGNAIKRLILFQNGAKMPMEKK